MTFGVPAHKPMKVTSGDLDGIEGVAREEVREGVKGRSYSVTPCDVLDMCAAIREARERVRVLTEALLDIAHPKMEIKMKPSEIALRVLNPIHFPPSAQ